MDLTAEEKVNVLIKAGERVSSHETIGLCSAIYDILYYDYVVAKGEDICEEECGDKTVTQILAEIFPYFTRENAILNGAPESFGNNPYWWPPTEGYIDERLNFLNKVKEDVQREL